MSILAQREQFSGKSHCTNVFGKQVHRCYQSTNGTSNGTRRKKLLAAFQEVSVVLLVHITHSASPTKKNLFPRDYKANICLQSALLDGKSALDYRFECWFICHRVQSSSMFEFQSISTLIHTKSAKSLSSVGGRKATMFAFLVMDLWTGRFAFFYWFASFSLSFFTPRENRKKLFMNFFLATVEFVRLARRR